MKKGNEQFRIHHAPSMETRRNTCIVALQGQGHLTLPVSNHVMIQVGHVTCLSMHRDVTKHIETIPCVAIFNRQLLARNGGDLR